MAPSSIIGTQSLRVSRNPGQPERRESDWSRIRVARTAPGSRGDWLRRLRRCLSRWFSDGGKRQKERHPSPAVRSGSKI